MKEATQSTAIPCPGQLEPPSFGLKSFAAPVASRPSLVLALSSTSTPVEPLRRARELADGLGATLHVLRVLPEEKKAPAILSCRNLPDVLRSVERTLTAHRSTRAWMREALPDGRGVDRFAILHGDFVDRTVVYARETDARLILVAPDDGEAGRLVTRLAAATGTPVLASRSRTNKQTIVAATDLRHPDYPVLHFASALGRQLEASVIAVHNLGQGAGVEQPAGSGRGATADESHEQRRARLQRASQRFSAARVVLREDRDPVDAILEQARAEEADLVVVGSPHRAWFERSRRAGVAGRVVDRARRSVLVIPVGEASEPPVELAWG